MRKVVHYSKTAGRPQLNDSSFKDGSKLQHLGKSDLYLKPVFILKIVKTHPPLLDCSLGNGQNGIAFTTIYSMLQSHDHNLLLFPLSQFWQNSSHWGRWILLYACCKIVVKVGSTWLKTVIIYDKNCCPNYSR